MEVGERASGGEPAKGGVGDHAGIGFREGLAVGWEEVRPGVVKQPLRAGGVESDVALRRIMGAKATRASGNGIAGR